MTRSNSSTLGTMPTQAPKLVAGHYCYYILDDSKDEHGYIPVLVVEDEAGYSPMSGNGKHAMPWYWGRTLDVARLVCEDANNRLGITPERASEIVASSMRESMRGRRGAR